MNRSKQYRSKLWVESLENRNLLAGNVAASVSGADLNINGDNLSNTITVESIGPDMVQVHGFGTSVNGTPDAIKSFHVTGSINIHMNGGNDVVRITNLLIHSNLTADLGAGSNQLLLGQSTTSDNVQFGGTPSGPLYVQGNQNVVGGVAADRVYESNVHVQGVGTLNLIDGDDMITLARPSGSSANVTYNGFLNVLPGVGNDTVNITGLVVDDNMAISDGGGAANVSIDSMDVHGNLNIATVNMSDTIGIQNTNVQNVLTMSTAGGNDTVNLSAIADHFNLDAGAGNDEIHVSSANINVVNAVLGAGADQLDLLSDTTQQIYGYGSDGDDLFLVRNTRAVDAFFYGESGNDTYQDSLLLSNSIAHLHLFTIEHQQHV